MNKIFESKWFVVLLLFILFFAEWLSFSYLNIDCATGFDWIRWWYVLGIWFVLGAIIMYGAKLEVYKLRMQIVKRFFNNALGMKWMSFVFILTFLVHIALISNTCYAVLTSNQLVWYAVFIPIIGIVFLCAIFPAKNTDGDKTENKKNKALLISGITSISERNMNLLFKPFEDYTGYSNIKRMVIILSDGLYNRNLVTRDGSFCELKKVLVDLNYDNTEIERKVLEYDQYMSDLKLFKLKELLHEILEKYFMVKFPQYPKIDIHLTQDYYDYNDFESCYVGIGEVIKNVEKKYKVFSSKTLIHISPGTAIITGVMSLYGIKANRELIYTRQDSSILVSFDLSVWTLDELLDELWKELDE